MLPQEACHTLSALCYAALVNFITENNVTIRDRGTSSPAIVKDKTYSVVHMTDHPEITWS